MARRSTRLAILDAAVKLFAQKGFDRATVDEVAAEANTAKGTVFYNFKSKEDIFRAILDKNAREFAELVEQRSSQGTSYTEKMEAAVDAAFEFLQLHDNFTSLLVSEAGHLRSRWIGESTLTPIDFFRHRMETIFHEGQEHGEFRTDIDPTDIGLIVFFMAAVVVIAWRLHDNHASENRLVKNSKLIFLKGLKA